MWLTLTLVNGAKTCVNLDKVAFMNEHKSGGTQIFFDFEITGADGRIQKEIIVQEKLAAIARKAKSRSF